MTHYPLAHLTESMGNNTSKRTNCPSCGGLNTLSMLKHNGVVKYLCFKLSCGIKGTIDDLTLGDVKKRVSGDKSNLSVDKWIVPEHFVLGIANEECLSLLERYNCLGAYKLGYFKCGFDPQENRLVIFILDELGSITGAVGRALHPRKEIPKTLNYSIDTPFICVPGKDTLILVEDCFSAIAVTRLEGYSGMALLGTNLKDSYIPYIAKYNKVIVALDADAKNKALKIKNTLDFYAKNVYVKFLEQDIKDMNYEKLRLIFNA
jgi:Zn ribbon nucleic-acid-binding protein